MSVEITRKRFMTEIFIKDFLVLAIFGGLYAPISVSPILHISPDIQESVISLMGFLMAAAIIGAFELSYTRTNLDDRLQRYLAHVTKFTLYSSILLLMAIAVTAIAATGTGFIHVMVMASFPVSVSLFLYDFWDALRALDDLNSRTLPDRNT